MHFTATMEYFQDVLGPAFRLVTACVNERTDVAEAIRAFLGQGR